MKIKSFLLLVYIFSSCTHMRDTTSALAENSGATNSDVISGAATDSVNISTDNAEKVFIKKAEIRRILKYYPELYDDFPTHPDVTYSLRGKNTNELQKRDDFDSEIGEDDYFALYAYFLYMRNCGEQYETQRDNLIRLYRDINFIMGRLAEGGTYYSHQHTRILGYAEYSVYIHTEMGAAFYHKSYNISSQKELYLKSLKRYIDDEVSINFDLNPKEKPILKKELFKTVHEIDGLITDYFYLDAVREFQYSHY